MVGRLIPAWDGLVSGANCYLWLSMLVSGSVSCVLAAFFWANLTSELLILKNMFIPKFSVESLFLLLNNSNVSMNTLGFGEDLSQKRHLGPPPKHWFTVDSMKVNRDPFHEMIFTHIEKKIGKKTRKQFVQGSISSGRHKANAAWQPSKNDRFSVCSPWVECSHGFNPTACLDVPGNGRKWLVNGI